MAKGSLGEAGHAGPYRGRFTWCRCSFPVQDCVQLPLRHTSVEELAAYLVRCCALLRSLACHGLGGAEGSPLGSVNAPVSASFQGDGGVGDSCRNQRPRSNSGH
jgi:hypothetical protein